MMSDSLFELSSRGLGSSNISTSQTLLGDTTCMHEHSKFGDSSRGLFSLGKWTHLTCGGDCCSKNTSHSSNGDLHSRCLETQYKSSYADGSYNQKQGDDYGSLVCECNSYIVSVDGTSGSTFVNKVNSKKLQQTQSKKSQVNSKYPGAQQSS